MKFASLLALLAACTVALVASAAQRVFIFDGDSTTAGAGDSFGGSFGTASNLAYQCQFYPAFQGRFITNFAISGTGLFTDEGDPPGLINRMTNYYNGSYNYWTTFKPTPSTNSTFIFMIGVNDMDIDPASLVDWAATWRQACKLMRTNGFVVVASTMTLSYVSERAHSNLLWFNQLIRTETTNYDLLQDSAAVLPNPNDSTMYNGLHPTMLGVSLLASNLNRILSGYDRKVFLIKF